MRTELRQSRDDAANLATNLRDELAQTMKFSTDTLVKGISALGTLQTGQLDGFGTQLTDLAQTTSTRLDGVFCVARRWPPIGSSWLVAGS